MLRRIEKLNPRRVLITIISILLLFSIIWALYPFIMNPTSVTDAYASAGILAPLVYLILVAVLPTPGAIIGASAASYFGLWQGWALLYIGNVLAVLLTFGLVRLFGRPAALRFLQPEKLERADQFLQRNAHVMWVVYAFPIFPLELITAAVALSARPLRHFIWIPVLALPIDAFIVTFFGDILSTRFGVFFEYISLLIVILASYALVHLFYRWKREEIQEAGRKIGEQGKRISQQVGVHVKHSVNEITDATEMVAKQIKKIGKKRQ